MNNKTIITLAVVAAAAGVGYYLWKKSHPTLPGTAPAPASGGGSGANASTASAYNGTLTSLLTGAVDWLKGPGASAGHLPNSNGGASPVTSSGDFDPSTLGIDGNGQYDYSLYE